MIGRYRARVAVTRDCARIVPLRSDEVVEALKRFPSPVISVANFASKQEQTAGLRVWAVRISEA
jgi:hypothetical protein